MAATLTLTGDFADRIGGDLKSVTRATLRTNLPPDVALYDAAGPIRLGDVRVNVASDGTFSVPGLVATNATDLNIAPNTLQYELVVEFRDGSQERRTWRSGWFALTASADIKNVGLNSPAVTPAVTTDSAMAANVNATASATRGALDAAIDKRAVRVVDEAIYLPTYPGIDPTGAADSTVGLANALASVPQTGATKGGRLRWGLNTKIRIDGQIDARQKENITFEGPATMPRSGSPAVLSFTRADNQSCFLLGSSNGVKIKGLRIETTSALYAGAVIDCKAPILADTQMLGIEDVNLLAPGSSAVLVSLLHAVGATISRTNFSGGAIGVRGYSDPVGSGNPTGKYAIGITIDQQCQFGNHATAGIYNPSISWAVVGNIFSPGPSGLANAIDGDLVTQALGLHIAGNYFGDAGSGRYVRVFAAGTQVAGNYFDGDNATGLYLQRPSYGVAVQANNFRMGGVSGVGIDCGTGGGPSIGVEIGANQMSGCTTKVVGHDAVNMEVDLRANYGVNDWSNRPQSFRQQVTFGNPASGSAFDLSGNLRMEINRVADLSYVTVRDGLQMPASGAPAATTLGAVARKMPLYDSAGGVLGYVPVYNTIT